MAETSTAAPREPRDPFRFGSLVESGISLVRANPLSILLPLVLIGAVSSGGQGGPRFDATSPPLSPQEMLLLLPFFAFVGVLAVVIVVALFILGSLAWLMAAKAALATAGGHRLDLMDAFRASKPQTLRAAWTFFLFFLAVIGGLILLVVPGFIVLAGLAPLSVVVAQEGLSGRAALRRTWELTRGHRWVLFGITLVAFLAAGLVSAVLMLAPGLGGAVGGVVWGTYVATMVVYYHRRIGAASAA